MPKEQEGSEGVQTQPLSLPLCYFENVQLQQNFSLIERY